MSTEQSLYYSRKLKRLKQKAKQFKKDHGVKQHEALDAIAQQEGFANWQALTQVLSIIND